MIPRLPTGEIRALTALRGLAAMAVVLQHFSATAQILAAHPIPSLVPHGYMAVDFFFVLSGFIMAYTYLDNFLVSIHTGPAPRLHLLRVHRDFLARRVARVLPLHIATLLLFVGLGMLTARLLGHDLFTGRFERPLFLPFDLPANILLLQTFRIGENINGPSWSISVEFIAYLVFPLLIIPAFHKSPIPRWAMAAICVAALVPLNLPAAEVGLPAVARCLAEFSLGMLTFGLFRSGALRWIGSDLSVIASLGAVALALLLRQDLPAALLFPAVVLACARNTGAAGAWLAARVPYFLGVISYSLYLIQNLIREPVLATMRAYHPAALDTASALALALTGTLMVVPFAWLAYRLIERPGRDRVRVLLHAGKRRS